MMPATLRAARASLAVALVAALACGRSTPQAPATAAPSPAAVDLTQRPVLAGAKPLALPRPVTRELPNGLRLVIVEHHELPLADVQLIIRSGGEADEPGKLGLATLTAQMLKEGAGRRSSLDIADQEAFLGVSLFAGSGFEQTTISLHTPTAQLDSALSLFADVALRPTFPEAELDRLKKNRLTGLLQLKDRGPAIADRAYAAIVFGREHPYGRPLGGDEAGTNAIARADVQRFYEAHYRPNNATLLVVGDVRPDDVERRARAIFGEWQRRDVPAVRYPAPPAAGKTTVYLIDKPGAAQSSFRIGLVGVARSTPDYYAIEVMNTVLGVPFTSRLNNNLRETKGYTYGAGSSFGMRRQAGPFTARAEIVAAKTDSALLEFMKELRAIRDTVPAAELVKAKKYLQNQLPADFETTGGIAGQLSSLLVYDLPLDFYNGYVAGVERVTQAEVQRVARQYVDTDRLAIVIVGDRASIEPRLRSLGVGEVVIRGLEGEPAR